ncbi:MAG: shikimate kinase [Aigarchaeota archaeon]|nr:shikimate kinase [Aigarchaeota archaeon]MDW8092267.1 shikimate kinase [Nitrososphaerota archaeon]
MKAMVVTNGAITIVNAISISKGSAMAIDLRTVAEVEVVEGGDVEIASARDRYGELEVSREGGLIREVVTEVRRRKGIDDLGFRVMVQSEIPSARGLKSSSSVGTAVAVAALKASGCEVRSDEVLEMVVSASIRSGTSITGALDDAAACLLGGVVVTDNLNRRLLMRSEAPSWVNVVLLIPPVKRYTGTFDRESLRPIKKLIEAAHDMATRGDFWTAATLNGVMHAVITDVPLDPIIGAMRLGAMASGMSGKGPTIFAVCEKEVTGDVRSHFSNYEGEVVVCSPTNHSALDELCSSRS